MPITLNEWVRLGAQQMRGGDKLQSGIVGAHRSQGDIVCELAFFRKSWVFSKRDQRKPAKFEPNIQRTATRKAFTAR